MIRVTQINLGGRRAALSELELQLSQGKFDVALIQEPLCRKGKIYGLSGGKVYYKEGNNLNKPRACIWVSNALANKAKCIGSTEFMTLDQSTVNMNIKFDDGAQQDLTISSIYSPNNPNIVSDNMESLVHHR